jgi:hypothetical protein
MGCLRLGFDGHLVHGVSGEGVTCRPFPLPGGREKNQGEEKMPTCGSQLSVRERGRRRGAGLARVVAGLVRGYWAGSDRVGPVAYLCLIFFVLFLFHFLFPLFFISFANIIQTRLNQLQKFCKIKNNI